MNYFAELDMNNIVKRVLVGDSIQWCKDNLGGTWVEREKSLKPGIGYTYDFEKKEFIPPPQEELPTE